MSNGYAAREGGQAPAKDAPERPGTEGTKDDEPFSFLALGEKSSKCAKTIADTKKINTKEFLATVKEIRKVFDFFGSVFSMAFSDIDTKVETIQNRLKETAGAEEDMYLILKWEEEYVAGGAKKNIIDDEKKLPSVTRAINRMCHVVELIYVLFERLVDDKSLEVSKGLKKVYPDTLAKIHGWFVQKTVGMAFSAVPARDKFLKLLGVDEEKLAEVVPDIVKHMKQIDNHIQQDFQKVKVEWNFQ